MGQSLRLTVIVCLAAGGVARADGLDAERFAPATGVDGGFSIEHPAAPYHLGWGLGLFLDLADDPVVEDTGGDMIGRRPLDTAASADLVGALGLFGWAELGVHLPVQMVYEGDDYPTGGTMLSASAGIGDLRVVPKVTVLRRGSAARHGLVAIAAPTSLPTGDETALRGAGGVTVEPRLLAALHVGGFGVVVGAGYRWRAEHPASLPWGDEIALALGLSYAITDPLTARLEVTAGKQVATEIEGADFPIEALAGVDYRLGDLDLFGGAGLGLTDGIGDPDVRVVAGVRYRHGAPEEHGFADSDGDGIIDHDDECPDAAEDEDGFRDTDGCPEVDNDEDGILDEDDECPELAEEPGGDRDGCPIKTYVTITEGKIYIFGKVQFRTGSAEIDPRSTELLDQIAQALNASPQVTRVRIEGHTDNVGGQGVNQRLSDERARAVRQALIDRGVDGGRLEPKGFGEDQPAAPNRTRAGRAKNRRVEFIIVESQ